MTNNKQLSDQEHKCRFIPSHDIKGWQCICGKSRFATMTGMAEYDPDLDLTVRVSDGKVLYKGDKS